MGESQLPHFHHTANRHIVYRTDRIDTLNWVQTEVLGEWIVFCMMNNTVLCFISILVSFISDSWARWSQNVRAIMGTVTISTRVPQCWHRYCCEYKIALNQVVSTCEFWDTFIQRSAMAGKLCLDYALSTRRSSRQHCRCRLMLCVVAMSKFEPGDTIHSVTRPTYQPHLSRTYIECTF